MRDFEVGDRVQGRMGEWYTVEASAAYGCLRVRAPDVVFTLPVDRVVARVRASAKVKP